MRYLHRIRFPGKTVSLSVDNTITIIGKNNSITSRFLERNKNVFIADCPYHLAYIAASNYHDTFSEYIGLNVEDVMLDLFYWFNKSAKRKGKLKHYFEFCVQEYQDVLKHLSVRWLSLERCISKATLKFTSQISYISSEGFSDERFQRFQEKFTNPRLKPALLFLGSALPLFTYYNQLLQREEPAIHFIKSAVEGLGGKVAKRIILPTKVREISSISKTDLNDPEENVMDTEDIYLGVPTKNMLKKILDPGDISQKQYKEFRDAAHHYLKSDFEHIQNKIPLDE